MASLQLAMEAVVQWSAQTVPLELGVQLHFLSLKSVRVDITPTQQGPHHAQDVLQVMSVQIHLHHPCHALRDTTLPRGIPLVSFVLLDTTVQTPPEQHLYFALTDNSLSTVPAAVVSVPEAISVQIHNPLPFFVQVEHTITRRDKWSV